MAHAKSGVSETHMLLENALLRHARLSTMLPKPRKRELDILIANLDDPRLPDYLLGLDSHVWKDESSRSRFHQQGA